ncbi:hypothetical protein C0W35_22300 [Photobacterium kishitanii]|uniref:hypothetical protein n=1 Tax=Photobacterium kishitanii TaxID=318456 RepID=UPI000D162EB9|nr:hypothetical protein [Photobacterium kishitanii]PSU86455.1 hypothetical protein C0W35_22300 [Photobacterium kishitanii]
MRNVRKKSILAIGLVIAGYWYYQSSQPQIWGDENNESYITIKGIKPADTKVDAWAIFGASGKNCKAKTWSAASGWSDGANVKWHITHNFSTNPEQYELRIPYLQFHDSFDCDVTLGDITVEAKNPLDTDGFAKLRIYQAGNDYDNKQIKLDSKIKAKKCNVVRNNYKNGTWKDYITCVIFADNVNLTKRENIGYNTVFFDFSKFKDDTVIHYDILAGSNYRSTPLEPQNNK